MPRSAARGGPQTRARIAEVANRLFVDRGFDAVTVADVAREAGVSSVTVFNHFPTKEDLFIDRASDAEDLLRVTIRERGGDVDAVTALHDAMVGLLDERNALAGVSERSIDFFRTVASSVVLIARARAIAARLERLLAAELAQDGRFAGDAPLLAAFFIGGYGVVLLESARAVIAGTGEDTLVQDHRARLERLFDALHAAFPA